MRTISRWDKVQSSTVERQILYMPGKAKTQRQANTHCQVHGCCHKKRFPQRFLWNTHSPDALLPAKRVWILESPLAHLAVAAHRPVVERRDKIDFSLHRHVLCLTLCLSKQVWEVRGCHIAGSHMPSTPLAWWWWWWSWWWWAEQIIITLPLHRTVKDMCIPLTHRDSKILAPINCIILIWALLYFYACSHKCIKMTLEIIIMIMIVLLQIISIFFL